MGAGREEKRVGWGDRMILDHYNTSRFGSDEDEKGFATHGAEARSRCGCERREST
jgi:hypothetical protein